MIVGILGGTFDPPHLGHLDVASIALDTGAVEQVWLVPCLTHRFGKSPAPFPHRLAMCRLLAETDERIRVSGIEEELNRPGYTLDLVMALREQYPETDFRLLAGTDIYHQKDQWHRYDDVARLAPPIYIERVGEPPIPEPTLGPAKEISSSTLRQMLSRGERPTGLTLESICGYIETHALYRNGK